MRKNGKNVFISLNFYFFSPQQHIFYFFRVNFWIFKCVAVAVAVAVAVVVAVVIAVVVAVATASAANKTCIFKCLKFLRIIIIFFHIFTENSKSGCNLKIAHSRGHA